MTRVILGAIVVGVGLVLATTSMATAHTPPQMDPDEFCALLALDIPGCNEQVAQILKERLARSTDQAHRRSTGSNSPFSPPSWASDCGTKFNGHTAEEWEPLVADIWSDEWVSTAVCIIHYESGGDPFANNCNSTATGLFQVMAHIWVPTFPGLDYLDLYDARINAEYAHRIWQIQGWWGAWPNTGRICHRD